MTEEQWSNLSGRAGVILNYGIKEKERLKNSKLARLITATPFLAGCEKAEETAFSHLILYLVSMDESARTLYFHKPIDDRDVHTRLFPVSNFLGGDAVIIQCCLDLIALTMLANYRKDAEEDKSLGKYNPLNAGKWDYTAESERLVRQINENGTADIFTIYTIEDALKGYWKE